MIEPLDQSAYDAGVDPIDWAAQLAATHIEVRDQVRAGQVHPGVPVAQLDQDPMATGRRIVASLLDAGWTPPTITQPDQEADHAE